VSCGRDRGAGDPEKSVGLLCHGRSPVTAFRFVAVEKANHAVATICRLLGVSRSGYYAWAARGPSARAASDVVMTDQIRAIHCDSDATYGSRRVHAQLLRDGVAVNVKRSQG